MRATIVASVLAWLTASPVASGQVLVTGRLDKIRFLAGEPIVVVLEAANTGATPVAELMTCVDDLQFSVVGSQRRPSPGRLRLGMTGVSGGCGAVSHPPVIEPGQRREVRHILRGYDLSAGTHTLQVDGKLRIRTSERTGSAMDAPVSSRLTFTIVPATPDELREVLRPLLEAAHGPPSAAKFLARSALIESAAGFLTEEIAVFAREGLSGGGEALFRIGTPRSHALLRELVAASNLRVTDQTALLESLVGFGDPADVMVIQALADDPRTDERLKSAARVAIARLGGDDAVGLLTRGLENADRAVERDTIEALGYTQSRRAVPVLIERFREETSTPVCRSLSVLTHRQWCDFGGLGFDSAATRRRWSRQWQTDGAQMAIYGAETFAAFEAEEERRRADTIAPAPIGPAPVVRPSPLAPRIDRVTPRQPSANSPVRFDGYNIGFGAPHDSVVIRFRQGDLEHVAKPGGGGAVINNGIEGSQFLETIAPPELNPGRCEISIEIGGRMVATTAVEIVAPSPLRFIRIVPATVHPSDDLVQVSTNYPPPATTRVEVVDAAGQVWAVESHVMLQGFVFKVPAKAADGIARIRLRPADAGAEPGTGLTFTITSGPLPLTPAALRLMRPVAPGQRTRLALDASDEFELRRIDTAEIEFEQNGRRIVVPLNGNRRHVRIPEQLAPGLATARSRTSIEATVSQWSAPVSIQILAGPATVSVEQMSSEGHRVWWIDGPGFVYARPGQVFTITGDLPDVAANVRVQLVRDGESKDVAVADADDELRITLPADLAKGDWGLRIGAASSSPPIRDVTQMRVQ